MNVGEFRHAMTVQTPARETVAGGEGYRLTWTSVSQNPWWCSMEPASEGRMERLAAGGAALMAAATHIMHGRYHDGITTRQRLVEGDRLFAILGVQNVQEGDMFTRVFAEEVEGQAVPDANDPWIQQDWTQ